MTLLFQRIKFPLKVTINIHEHLLTAMYVNVGLPNFTATPYIMACLINQTAHLNRKKSLLLLASSVDGEKNAKDNVKLINIVLTT
ncbi:hypothetical protein [Cytobacillus massiliigabonensis]|uniref:hypothetical protein n=1 Tax=Cytobacillus massiliigabonensis TaxID=1871011 RepID=UPI0011570646|nr:hypothetical protein [Cytobacillus massiliigabonensis]